MAFCPVREPFYDEPRCVGLVGVTSRGDGYTIGLEWRTAHPDSLNFKVAYNIYFSTIREDIYTEGVKAVATDVTQTLANITSFSPGDMFYFSVRATQFDISDVNTELLPSFTNSDGYLRMYSEGPQLADIDESDLLIPVGDIELFPSFGIVQIGYELIRYTNVDVLAGNLVVPVGGRGYLGTDARFHQTDGYDGYVTHDPIVKFWKGYEEGNTVIFQAESRFAHPFVPCVSPDGYRFQKDCVTTDLSASDEEQVENPKYPFDGWHRTPPSVLLSGACLDTYIGGERGCADGYAGVNNQLRGLDLNERDQERLEVLLETTGEPVVLVRRIWDGITCSCVTISKESPELRCPKCFGTGFVGGYEQLLNTRRSDRRILMRFNPAPDDLKVEDAGLESFVLHETWTLAYPAIKDRDFVIRFNQDGTEEFRYEVLDVTRNKLLDSFSGRQVMRVQRVRRSSPIYQWRAIRDASTMPQDLQTSIGGFGTPLPPHSHQIVINENIVALSQINQTTSKVHGHVHAIENGVVRECLGHTHTIILP